MSCEERCEPFEHAFRRPALHLFGGALYAYQTSSDAMPGPSRRQRHHNGRPNEGIMPSETKFSGLMPGFLTEMRPLGPSMGSIERCKTVQKWICGMTQESATQWNHGHAPQTCYPHPLERTQRLGPRGMAITGSRYNVLVKSSKNKGSYSKGYE